MSVPESAPQKKTPAYAYYVVGVLMLAYVFAFIDRIILSLMVDPIRADLDLTDTHISLLAGFAFALFYTVLGIPFGRWVDTRGRRNLIAFGIALWSLATVACGLANNFTKLFLARMTVGVGEATLAPAAYSMIPDLFPPHRVAFAMAVFMSGVTIGGGLAMLLGGIIVEWATSAQPVLPFVGQIAPWKVVFIAVGLPGVLVSLLILLTVKEPVRRIQKGFKDEAPPLSSVIGYVIKHARVYAPAIFGFTGIVVAGYAFQFWAPAYFMRVHNFTPGQVGALFGIAFAIVGTLGVLTGGALSDRLTAKGRKDAPILVAMWAAVIQAPLFVACYLNPSALWAQVAFTAALFFASMFGGLQGATIQMLTPNRMRGVVSAIYLVIANMIGLGIAPTITALVSEHFFGGPMGIGKALAVTAACSLTIGAILLAIARKPARERVAALEGGCDRLMITLYGGATPNARKVSIALEEMGLPWRLELIDILNGDQLTPEFLAINPNNKAPAIIDDDPPAGGDGKPFVLWESGAILLYLAEKTGRFMPTAPAQRAIAMQWLMFQMSGIGPMFGQNAHFEFYAKERHEYAANRYANEVDRLLRVLEMRLAESAFIAGDDYTIVDMATFPYLQRQLQLNGEELPHMSRWADGIRARSAMQRGMQVGLAELRKETIEGGLSGFSDDHRSILFGEKQFERFKG